MRALAKIMALILLPLVGLAACDQKTDAQPSATYDTTPASNAKFLTDYAARPGVIKLPSGPDVPRAQGGQRPVRCCATPMW